MPIRGFPSHDLVACFDEAPGGGDIEDINAPCNAPAKTPANYLTSLIWHSDLFQYEVALEASVTINHAGLGVSTLTIGTNGFSIGGGGASVTANINGAITSADYLLATHGLGFIPTAMVALDGRMLPSGFLAQLSGGSLRELAPFVTTSGVYIRDTSISSSVALPPISLTYRVMVFNSRAKNPAMPLFGGSPTTMNMARGIIDGSRKYAKQVAVGESPYSINIGPTLDIANGRVRSATGGIVQTEPSYSGSFAAPAFRNIGL